VNAFTALPDDQTLAATVVALEEHGFSEVVDDLDAARDAVLARIPDGASVMMVHLPALPAGRDPLARSRSSGRSRGSRTPGPVLLDARTPLHRQKALDDDNLQRYAVELGLSVSRFDQDRFGSDVQGRIRRDVESGPASAEVRGTPTLFIDGVLNVGGYDATTLMEVLAR
jgi:hypothetical protein